MLFYINGRILFIGSILMVFFSCSQGNKETPKILPESREAIVCFYNVENLFDTLDNPHANDEEFLPSGKKEWDYYKYMNKSNRIAQTMRAIGEATFPQLIGLCEVENKMVLQDLLIRPAFHNKNFGIIHQESPDPRGIDVGLLYDMDHFTEILRGFLSVNSNEHHVRSRDILYAALATNVDTFHVYVNHWPSRRGGQLNSEPKRMYAATLLSAHIDSIQEEFPDAHFIIMGDFNDDPWSPSLNLLVRSNNLLNLSSELEKCGTTYYKKEWYCFDQILVSKNLYDEKLPYTPKLNVANFDFLSNMATDGVKVPNRTYKGYFYSNGFSDHYPVFIKLYH